MADKETIRSSLEFIKNCRRFKVPGGRLKLICHPVSPEYYVPSLEREYEPGHNSPATREAHLVHASSAVQDVFDLPSYDVLRGGKVCQSR